MRKVIFFAVISIALSVGALTMPRAAIAVVIGNDAPTGNQNPPPGVLWWDNVVNVNGASGVYIGNGYVLTGQSRRIAGDDQRRRKHIRY